MKMRCFLYIFVWCLTLAQFCGFLWYAYLAIVLMLYDALDYRYGWSLTIACLWLSWSMLRWTINDLADFAQGFEDEKTRIMTGEH